ncbi:rho GTPase-activating protein 40 isoform X2 [Syngnathoides biaculeatus]|uniref:rho GTPase-activating protein 40 isoform X2 n=1 Tax=Syngnathoides biaculeatus TaxID=300417 RepID=UPI002ADE7869|nr:rho GTPase-activating protein 40 isoform X2 [Syngnathoides biaculeatus]
MPRRIGGSVATLLLSGRGVGRAKARDPSPTEMSAEPWASPQDQAAAEHGARTSPSPPSQDQEQHPDKLCLDSFWNEVETIRLGGGLADLDATRRDSRQSEEGEQEEQWLADAGLSNLIGEGGEDADNAVLLSTLTRTQAEAVQRRVDSYTMSLRKRNKPAPRHVRDIFATPIHQGLPESQHSGELAQNSMTSVSKTPLSAPKEEFFFTDVAYCDQAAIFLKQAKLTQNSIQRRREDATLPRVVCPKCRLGITRIQDLSHADMKKVRQLALIDMTALCDLIGLEVKRHKTAKRKMPESPLFGVPLATLLENDQKVKAAATTPLLLQELLTFLEKKGVDSEGILRVPGSLSRIKLLQQNLEANFYTGHIKWEEVSPNDAAALLKKFIRELPAPLLTAEYLNTFSAVRDVTELKQKLHMLNLLILLLPEPNRNTLKALLEFLSKVVSREKRNRMNLWAVATIMAPNLFLHKAVPSTLTEGAEKGQVEKAADVMRLLIRYQDLLWTIPNFVMNQVRKLNENSNRRYQFYDRRFKNFLRKIHTDSKEKPDKNTSEPRRTVKIHIGDQVSGSMDFQIHSDSLASDLLTQFYQQFILSPETGKTQRRRNGSMSYSECALYEVGGNIGEHRLDPETHLLDLYNSNSGGEWVLKMKATASRGL